MFCLGLEISNYKQLGIIDPPLIQSLEEKIDKAVKQNNVEFIKKKSGLFLYSLGDEAEADPKEVLDAAFQVAAAVREFRDQLYGYNLFLSTQSDRRPAALEARVAAAFLEIMDEEALWMDNRDAELFKNHASFEAGDAFTRIIESKKTEPTYNVISYIPQVRKKVIERLAQVFIKWLAKAKNNPALMLVTGPPDSAQWEIATAALAAIIGKERGAIVQEVGFRSAALSPVAPLVESLNAAGTEFLKRVPSHLEPHEKRIWKSYESFLQLLLAGRPVTGDRSETDFFIVYHLYLTAYFRFMRDLHLPGIMLFRRPERLAPAVAARLRTLFGDLTRRFRVAVVLVSARRQIPAAFREFAKMRVTIKAFGRRDTRRCFSALYPGVSVPRKVVETVVRLSQGRYAALLHYIYYLRLNRKIVQEGSRFAWVPRKKLAVKIPVRSRTASITVMRSLKEEARTVLFVGYSLGGFFSPAELLDFFASSGLQPDRVKEQLAYLKSMELYFGNDRPGLSGLLRGVLRRLSAQKTKYLEDQMRQYVSDRLPQFLPGRAARCFRFLASVAAADLVVDHLAFVINYCLDARLRAAAEFFLKPERYLRLEDLSEERRKRLEYILFSHRLRFHLLTGDVDEADKLAGRNTLSVESLVPQASFARLYLELGRYHLCREDTAKALPLLKKAVHFFQELDMTGPSSESFLELGCGFLAKGNLREALEYFSFAKKLIQDAAAPFIHTRALWFESTALYLQGNYSRILADCDEAALLSGSHCFREAELLFGVLKARVLFDLGFYDRAAGLFREGLALARVYGEERVRTTLFAWLARCAAYQEQTDYARALLRTLEETDETLFIRGEVLFLQGEDKKAEKVFAKALNRRAARALLFPEYNTWESGFALVEGRCLELNVHGTPLIRLCRAFRAVLQCRAGDLEAGIAELHLLCSTEKFNDADPHAALFFYLYYTVLKTIEKKKTSVREMGHGLTILNKALKHLQERSTFIDEPRDRIRYLTENYWNKQILEEAKLNKLV